MRIIFPEEIKNMLEKQRPYLRYAEGEGMVLVDNAPPEIVEMRKKTMKWVDDNLYSC